MDEKRLSQGLDLLRTATTWTGVVYPAQLAQIHTWVVALCEHVSEFGVQAEDGLLKVVFRQNKTDIAEPDNLRERLEFLTIWVQGLLGPTWKVEVYQKRAKKPFYVGAPRV